MVEFGAGFPGRRRRRSRDCRAVEFADGLGRFGQIVSGEHPAAEQEVAEVGLLVDRDVGAGWAALQASSADLDLWLSLVRLWD